MSRRGLFLAVGFVWGALIGLGAALTVSAAAAGLAWIYLFGDSPWPDWANWAILGAGGAAGLLAFMVSMTVARLVANRYDAGDGEMRGNGLAWLLLLLGLVAVGGFAWHEIGRQRDAEAAREQTAATARYFSMLLSETHRVDDIAVEWPGGGRDGGARLSLDGLRSGNYRLSWQVRDSLYEASVLSGEKTLRLTSGPRSMDIPLPAQRIVDGYRGLLSRQDTGIMVDEPFLFEVQLAPVPSEDEIARMPAHEVRNLAAGQSALIDRSSAEFQVRFFLYPDGPSWD